MEVIENHGFADGGGERWTACPHCLDTNYEEAHYCENCLKVIPETQAAYNMCAKCEAAALKRFKEALAGFTADELRYLDACIEGIGITAPDEIQNLEA